jgi:hypothetical protein
MANARIDRLLLADKPWTMTFPASAEDAYTLAWKLQRGGTAARVIRGSKMATLDGFFGEIGAALQFPAYFGENWPALDECLKDLSWLPAQAYVLIVTDAGKLFRDDDHDSLATFLRLVESAAEEWAAPSHFGQPWDHGSVPFHVVFQVPQADLRAWQNRVHAAGHKVPEASFDLTD